MNRSSILYVSIDMELSGNYPDKHFPTEIGLVAFDGSSGKEIGCLQTFLQADEGKVWDKDTFEWYQKQPGYKTWSMLAVPAKQAMQDIKAWLTKLRKGYEKMAFIAYPTAFDGQWFHIMWYRHLGHPTGGKGPGFTFIDIRSFAAGKLGVDVFQASKWNALKPFLPNVPHTHLAVDDAREQGQLYFNALNNSK
jgi:3'-5' exoribonuclease Rv2179c-like domain